MEKEDGRTDRLTYHFPNLGVHTLLSQLAAFNPYVDRWVGGWVGVGKLE